MPCASACRSCPRTPPGTNPWPSLCTAASGRHQQGQEEAPLMAAEMLAWAAEQPCRWGPQSACAGLCGVTCRSRSSRSRKEGISAGSLLASNSGSRQSCSCQSWRRKHSTGCWQQQQQQRRHRPPCRLLHGPVARPPRCSVLQRACHSVDSHWALGGSARCSWACCGMWRTMPAPCCRRRSRWLLRWQHAAGQSPPLLLLPMLVRCQCARRGRGGRGKGRP